MTEQEFRKQVWRMYDIITLNGGVEGKVFGVNFYRKSVHACISNVTEWVPFEFIETHITSGGNKADEDSNIDLMQKRIDNQTEVIKKLEEENKILSERTSDDALNDLLRAVKTLTHKVELRKNYLDQVSSCITEINRLIEKSNDD